MEGRKRTSREQLVVKLSSVLLLSRRARPEAGSSQRATRERECLGRSRLLCVRSALSIGRGSASALSLGCHCGYQRPSSLGGAQVGGIAASVGPEGGFGAARDEEQCESKREPVRASILQVLSRVQRTRNPPA